MPQPRGSQNILIACCCRTPKSQRLTVFGSWRDGGLEPAPIAPKSRAIVTHKTRDGDIRPGAPNRATPFFQRIVSRRHAHLFSTKEVLPTFGWICNRCDESALVLSERRMRGLRLVATVMLALFFTAAGINHFLHPAVYVRIVPSWLPAPALLVQISGICEILGGIGVRAPLPGD